MIAMPEEVEISIHNPVLIHNNISLSQMQILNDISQIITITNSNS